MRLFVKCFSALAMVSLISCGGGGGNADGGSGTATATVASIEILTSATSLASADNTTGVTVSAVVKDSSNNALASQPLVFSASSGILGGVSATTGVDGRATAKLTAGNDRSNRDVVLTVKSGGVTKTAVLPVTGTTLSASGATSVLAGSVGNFAVSVRDSSGLPVAGVPVKVSSTLNNAVTLANGGNTDANGGVAFTYSATNPGTDTLNISGAGASQTLNVTVSSLNFAFSSPSAEAEIGVGTQQAIVVRYLSGGVGVPNKTVAFSTTRGSVNPSQVVTDANGNATTQLTSQAVGSAIVSASVDANVVTTLPVNFVSRTPASLVLQTSTAAVAPNAAGSTVNQAELRATVRDAAGNPVKGQTVFFTAVKDLSGGKIKTGTAITDSNGLATDIFIAGAVSTATNGVQVRATVPNTSISADANITVNGQALFITIAANNTVEKLSTQYRKTFSVQVSDSNGSPVANQSLTVSVWPSVYRKGTLKFDAVNNVWFVDSFYVTCQNEDINRDGKLDAGEDFNSNGVLTPGQPGLVSPANLTTDAAGNVEFTVTYGQQFAYWIDFDLNAKATVAGTESGAFFLFPASVPVSDATNKDVPPAAFNNPFGSALSCSDKN
ncbi:Ig-like domain-containing protein [Acidovorax temperans]|uniref:Ig-like domain-containing protein n=1 Tax=Acidovorax temperans TaxID=80878 RepID=UPI0030CEF219